MKSRIRMRIRSRNRGRNRSMLAPAPAALSLRMQQTTRLARCARAFWRHRRPFVIAQLLQGSERSWAMTNWTTLPYENLRAYQAARELLVVVHEARLADTT